MAHTKGPWETYGPMIFSPENGVICQLSEIHPESKLVTHQEPKMWSPDWEEIVANGKLVSAAPDLLEACEAALADHMKRGMVELDTMAKIKWAIEKAKGE